MDSLRALDESDFDLGFVAEDEPQPETLPEIGLDERRMHVRAYNYWVSLLAGRVFPSIEDIEPNEIDDFGPNSVILDFTAGPENPSVAFIGRALREECGLPLEVHRISDIPSRSLLSRLTDHYLQIIANAAPIGFEAEFINYRGNNALYRGILMPFSSDNDTIDFIYGVINWKEVVSPENVETIAREVGREIVKMPVADGLVWADGPSADPANIRPATRCNAPGCDTDGDQHMLDLELVLGEDAGIHDFLGAARASAEMLRGADARSRTALYRTLGHAYDFALAAEAEPEDYAELLDDADLKAQARAPMTPIVKLIFGIDYDKARLTEFAAALSYGRRTALERGTFTKFMEEFPGGLKAIVQAERQARRPDPQIDQMDIVRASLRTAPPIGLVDLPGHDTEFVLLVARRTGSGQFAVVAPVEAGEKFVEKALRRAAS